MLITNIVYMSCSVAFSYWYRRLTQNLRTKQDIFTKVYGNIIFLKLLFTIIFTMIKDIFIIYTISDYIVFKEEILIHLLFTIH